MHYPVWIRCCKRPNCDFYISQDSSCWCLVIACVCWLVEVIVVETASLGPRMWMWMCLKCWSLVAFMHFVVVCNLLCNCLSCRCAVVKSLAQRIERTCRVDNSLSLCAVLWYVLVTNIEVAKEIWPSNWIQNTKHRACNSNTIIQRAWNPPMSRIWDTCNCWMFSGQMNFVLISVR